MRNPNSKKLTMTNIFPITRIYSGNDEDTYFEDIIIPMKHVGDIGSLSEATPVKSIIFREVIPSYDYDFHNAPQRQYLVLLDGVIEIETSLGDKRVFKAGDIVLLEDIAGKGHKTRNIKIAKRRSLFITL